MLKTVQVVRKNSISKTYVQKTKIHNNNNNNNN